MWATEKHVFLVLSKNKFARCALWCGEDNVKMDWQGYHRDVETLTTGVHPVLSQSTRVALEVWNIWRAVQKRHVLFLNNHSLFTSASSCEKPRVVGNSTCSWMLCRSAGSSTWAPGAFSCDLCGASSRWSPVYTPHSNICIVQCAAARVVWVAPVSCSASHTRSRRSGVETQSPRRRSVHPWELVSATATKGHCISNMPRMVVTAEGFLLPDLEPRSCQIVSAARQVKSRC